MKIAYLIDAGILLPPGHEEFESYAIVYDKKYGYYDEIQHYVSDKIDAIQEAQFLVVDGGENSYAIVSVSNIPDDYDFEQGELLHEDYILKNVEYSIAKINGRLIENFLNL